MPTMLFRALLVVSLLAIEVGCDDPEAQPAPPQQQTAPSEPAPVHRIELHEWGLIDGDSLHAGHPTRTRPAAMRAPVIYAHLPDGVDEVRFDLSVRLGESHRIMEHYPGGGALMPGEPLVWSGVRATRGECGERTYPSERGAGCRTEDRICEAQHGRRWETADGACLQYGERFWDHLFYRAQLGDVQLPVTHVIEDEVLRVETEQTLVGMVYRAHDGRVAWTDPPTTGARAELPVPSEGGVQAAMARIKADLGFHGLTPDEADAFLREWGDLFAGRSLLYWLPTPTLDSIATLQGENIDVKRAILVRVPLT